MTIHREHPLGTGSQLFPLLREATTSQSHWNSDIANDDGDTGEDAPSVICP